LPGAGKGLCKRVAASLLGLPLYGYAGDRRPETADMVVNRRRLAERRAARPDRRRVGQTTLF
jgi:hypothetical protein